MFQVQALVGTFVHVCTVGSIFFKVFFEDFSRSVTVNSLNTKNRFVIYDVLIPGEQGYQSLTQSISIWRTGITIEIITECRWHLGTNRGSN